MKKFLSLVLAVIMTMSLVTISAGATEYRDLTDKDEIQYEEAVAVLNRLGIITGYDDGSFRPDDELTRGAAAKIIVSLLIGPDAASGLTAPTAPYPDVPTTHTFAGVISFCKTSEIISGYGDGTFKPGNSLTGFAFAKMLLGALGYKSNIEGFVDTGWTQNVAKVGNVAGLFDRLDFDGAGAVNRETACQLALNTLKATMVTYGGTTVVTGANQQSYMVQGTQAMYVTSNNREINANINRRVINATNNEMTLEFGEEHFKDLRLEHDKYDPAYDIYGHPSNEWSYKKVTIGTFALEADFKYTTQISHIEDTVATKEKALGLRGYDTYSTDHRANYTNWSSAAGGQYQYNSPFNDATQIHINGWNARVRNDDYSQGSYPANVDRDGQVYTYDASKIGASNKEEAPSLSEIADLTDNGVTVEVYVCPVDADFITDVVVTRTQLMKVDRITSDAIYMETITPDSTDVVRDAETLDEIAGYNDNALNKEVISVKDDNYDAYNALKDMKAGDRMAIIPYTADDGKTWEVGEAYQPETVSGVLTNVDIYNTSRKPDGNAVAITVGGTTYPIAQWNKDMIDVSGPQIKATRKDVTLYLDKLGNAMWADEIGNSDAWMIVGDYYQATGVSSRVDWFVHGWTISGEEIDLDLGTIRGEAEKYAPGELVRYAISDGGNGEYTLTKPNYNGEYVLKRDYNKTNYDARTMFSNGRSSEQPLLKDGESTGEGIYTVAQYAWHTGNTIAPVQYNIKKGNDYIPLDRYNTQENSAILPTTASGLRLDYSAVSSQSGISYNTATDAVTAPATFAADWTYKIAPYDGVKFIFVGFDSSTGEVDTIDVVDGPVNVDYSDLIQINRYWRNVGTNVDNWVASPAEAYVNDKGLVKAVVIKNDAAEPSMSDYYIITDNKGSDTVVKSTGADAPTSGTYYTRQYVCGADGFKEEKTGYFDKALEVGTIITGRLGSDGVIKSRVFHANEYTNKNPDALYIKGIGRVMTLNNKVSESSFVVSNEGSNIVATVGTGRGYGHTLDVNTCDILGDEIVMGDTAVSNHSGLIKVDSATQFIDLRPGRPGDIKDLGDLLDYKNDSNIILKVLLNGNKSSDGFRRAYAVVILNATTAGANDVVIGSGSLMPVTDNNSGFVYAIRTPDGSTNGIRYNTIAGLQRDLKVGDIVEIHVKPGFSIEVDKAGDPQPVDPQPVDGPCTRLTIPGDSPVPVVISKISDTTNPEPVTVTINSDTAGVNVQFVGGGETITGTTIVGTTTVTLTKGTKYTVSVDAGYTVNLTEITAGTNDSVTVSKDTIPTGDDLNIPFTGIDGVTVTFSAEGMETITVNGTEAPTVKLPEGKVVTVAVSLPVSGYHVNITDADGNRYTPDFVVKEGMSVTVKKSAGQTLISLIKPDGSTGYFLEDGDAEETTSVDFARSVHNSATELDGYYKMWFVGVDEPVLVHIVTVAGRPPELIFADSTPTSVQQQIISAANSPSGAKIENSTPSNEDEFNGSIPNPPADAEGVKAIINLNAVLPVVNITFGSYDPSEALTEKQVEAAINEALGDETVKSLDLANGVVTTSRNRLLTLNPTAKEGAALVDGSYEAPAKTYKITVCGTDYYNIETETVTATGLTKMAAILPENIIADKSTGDSGEAILVTEGTADITVGTEDAVYVAAVVYVGKGTAGSPADFDGANAVYAVPANGAPVALSVTGKVQYVQKTAGLLIQNVANAGKPVSLKINGVAVSGTYDANGEFKCEFTEGRPADQLKIEAGDGEGVTYKVSFEGDVIAEAAEAGRQISLGDIKGASVIFDDGDGNLDVATGGKTSTAEAWYVVTGDDANSDGEINLFMGFTVDPTVENGSSAWTASLDLNEKGNDLSAETIDGATVLKAGTTVYLKAATADTGLKVDSDVSSTLTIKEKYTVLGDEIIYVTELNGNVNNNSVAVSVDLHEVDFADTQKIDAVAEADLADGPKEITFKLQKVMGATTKSTVEAAWFNDTARFDNSKTTAKCEEENTLTIKTVVIGQLAAAEADADGHPVLTITVDGISTDVDLKVTAKAGG